MATSNQAAWQNIQSKLMAMGGIREVIIGEPKKPIDSATVAIIPVGGDIPETTLKRPRETHIVILRRYEQITEEPSEEIEFGLDQWRADILEDIFGEFDLGGNIAYPLPADTSWEYGEDALGNRDYRTLDIVVSYRVDDNATFTA